MSNGERTPAMADVARIAGVSMMTVSRVINDHPRVSDATRKRVQAAIDQLGYRTNMAARTLAGGRSRVLGAISSETIFFGASRTLWGIEVAARQAGHFVNFVTVPTPSRPDMAEAVGHLMAAHVEGIVVIAPMKASIDALADLRVDVPMVITSGSTNVATTVGIDQELGARLATRHLLELGHRTVHHLRGPKGWIGAEARAKGWRDELKSHGCLIPTTRVGDWTPASGYAAGKAIAADRDVTAVFAGNDEMALGLMLALGEAGLRVPDDVSVVGFDDTPESGFFAPPLTTIHQDFSEVGRRAAEQLLSLIDDEPAGQITIEPSLVVRASTAPPRRR